MGISQLWFVSGIRVFLFFSKKSPFTTQDLVFTTLEPPFTTPDLIFTTLELLFTTPDLVFTTLEPLLLHKISYLLLLNPFYYTRSHITTPEPPFTTPDLKILYLPHDTPCSYQINKKYISFIFSFRGNYKICRFFSRLPVIQLGTRRVYIQCFSTLPVIASLTSWECSWYCIRSNLKISLSR